MLPLVGLHEGMESEHDFGAAREGRGAPVRKGFEGAGDGGIDLDGAGEPDACARFPCGGIPDDAGAVGLRGEGFAGGEAGDGFQFGVDCRPGGHGFVVPRIHFTLFMYCVQAACLSGDSSVFGVVARGRDG